MAAATLLAAMLPISFTLNVQPASQVHVQPASGTPPLTSRRDALLGAAAATLLPAAAFAADAEEGPLIDQVKAVRLALDLPALNALIDEEKWDSVRSVLKVAPVNTAWEQSQKLKNPLRKLADLRWA